MASSAITTHVKFLPPSSATDSAYEGWDCTPRSKKCSSQMIRIPRLPTMRSQYKSIKIPLLPPSVQTRHIREQIVKIVTVRGILFCIPLIGRGEFAIQSAFGFGFIVDAIETDDALEEDVQFRMSLGVLCYFEERLEDV